MCVDIVLRAAYPRFFKIYRYIKATHWTTVIKKTYFGCVVFSLQSNVSIKNLFKIFASSHLQRDQIEFQVRTVLTGFSYNNCTHSTKNEIIRTLIPWVCQHLCFNYDLFWIYDIFVSIMVLSESTSIISDELSIHIITSDTINDTKKKQYYSNNLEYFSKFTLALCKRAGLFKSAWIFKSAW